MLNNDKLIPGIEPETNLSHLKKGDTYTPEMQAEDIATESTGQVAAEQIEESLKKVKL